MEDGHEDSVLSVDSAPPSPSQSEVSTCTIPVEIVGYNKIAKVLMLKLPKLGDRGIIKCIESSWSTLRYPTFNCQLWEAF